MPQNFEDLKGKIVRDPEDYFYKIIDIIFNISTTEKMILFKDFYNEYNKYVLSENDFSSKTDKNIYPNSSQEFLFQAVDSADSTPPFTKSKQSKSIVRDSIDFMGKVIHSDDIFYFVFDLAYDYNSNTPMVLYHLINFEKKILTIPKEIFLAKLDPKKCPDSKQKYLYELVNSNIALHLVPKKKDLINLKGRVFKRYDNLYYIVIDLPENPDTGEAFVLVKSFFGKYDTKILSRSYFLAELNSKLSSKYKEKYIYNLVKSEDIPKRAPFKDWIAQDHSNRFKHNLFWSSVLIIFYVFTILHFISTI